MITSELKSDPKYQAVIEELCKGYASESNDDYMIASHIKDVLVNPHPYIIDIIEERFLKPKGHEVGLAEFKVSAEYICNTLYEALKRHSGENCQACARWHIILASKFAALGKKVNLEQTQDMQDITKSMFKLAGREKEMSYIQITQAVYRFSECIKIDLQAEESHATIIGDTQLYQAYILDRLQFYILQVLDIEKEAEIARLERLAKLPAGFLTNTNLQRPRPQPESGCQIL